MQPKLPPHRGPLAVPSYQPPSAPPVTVHGPGAVAGNSDRSSGQLPKMERGQQTSNQFLRTPFVRYSSVMRVGKQHPMRISLTGANGDVEPAKPQSLSGGFDPPILVQVTIPGALVTPSHQIIPLSGGDANFLVQPISSGKLKGAKVEFLSQGRKISEIPLPIKANKGLLSKWLLALGILLPIVINFMPNLSYRLQSIDVSDKGAPSPSSGNNRLSPNFGGTNPTGKARTTPTNSLEKNNKVTVPSKSSETSPEKSPEKAPEKFPEKKSVKSPSLTYSFDAVEVFAIATLIAVQDPAKNATDPTKSDSKPSLENKALPSKSETTRPPVRLENNARVGPSNVTLDKDNKSIATQNSTNSTSELEVTDHLITYRGEDAIWAWIRHKLYQQGYKTKTIPGKEYEDRVSQFLIVNRNYEITGESSKELSTSRIGVIGLYYLEPVLRFLYRVFIQFPKDIPLADLWYGLFFIALGIIAWVMTGPNRKKIKGSVMDIRLAS